MTRDDLQRKLDELIALRDQHLGNANFCAGQIALLRDIIAAVHAGCWIDPPAPDPQTAALKDDA